MQKSTKHTVQKMATEAKELGKKKQQSSGEVKGTTKARNGGSHHPTRKPTPAALVLLVYYFMHFHFTDILGPHKGLHIYGSQVSPQNTKPGSLWGIGGSERRNRFISIGEGRVATVAYLQESLL